MTENPMMDWTKWHLGFNPKWQKKYILGAVFPCPNGGHRFFPMLFFESIEEIATFIQKLEIEANYLPVAIEEDKKLLIPPVTGAITEEDSRNILNHIEELFKPFPQDKSPP